MINLPLPRGNEPEDLEEWAKNLKIVLEEFLRKIVSGQIKITNIHNIGVYDIDWGGLADGAVLKYDAASKTFKLEV